MQSPIGEMQREEYNNSKTHNITLASFTIVAISVILAWPTNTLTQPEQVQAIDSVFYLSIGMIAFFVASYLFTIRITRLYVFTAQSLEYMGIIATALGFLDLFLLKVNDTRVIALYTIFVGGIVALGFLDLHFNRRYFSSSPDERGRDSEHTV